MEQKGKLIVGTVDRLVKLVFKKGDYLLDAGVMSYRNLPSKIVEELLS